MDCVKNTVFGLAVVRLKDKEVLMPKSKAVEALDWAATLCNYEPGEWTDEIIELIALQAGVRLKERYPDVVKAKTLKLNESDSKAKLQKHKEAGWVCHLSVSDGNTSEHILFAYADIPEPA